MGRSLIPKGGNDRIMTPDRLAEDIVAHFNPFGQLCLEPCKGEGAFIRAFQKMGIRPEWCEIDDGRNFFDYTGKVDWIITNPPYSILTDFMEHSFKISENVVFLCLGNAPFFKKRLRIMKEHNFGFKKFIFVDTPPKPWPQFGIQLSVVHMAKGYNGPASFSYEL